MAGLDATGSCAEAIVVGGTEVSGVTEGGPSADVTGVADTLGPIGSCFAATSVGSDAIFGAAAGGPAAGAAGALGMLEDCPAAGTIVEVCIFGATGG